MESLFHFFHLLSFKFISCCHVIYFLRNGVSISSVYIVANGRKACQDCWHENGLQFGWVSIHFFYCRASSWVSSMLVSWINLLMSFFPFPLFFLDNRQFNCTRRNATEFVFELSTRSSSKADTSCLPYQDREKV